MSTTTRLGPLDAAPASRKVYRRLLGVLWLVRAPALLLVWLSVAAVLTLAGNRILLAVTDAAAVPLLLYGGAFALNDVLDANADRRNSPWRPIPSGMITRREAMAIVFFCYGSGAALALARGPVSTVYASVFVSASIWYSVQAKQVVWLKNPLAVLLSNSVFLYASGAGAPTVGGRYLVGGAVLLGLGRELLMDVHDLPGDHADGRRTVAVVLGAGPTTCVGMTLCAAGVLWAFAPVVGWTFAAVNLKAAWMTSASAAVVLFWLGLTIVRGSRERKVWLLAESIKVYMFLVLVGILVA